jgi:predicted MFS family arabinose efflux permease
MIVIGGSVMTIKLVGFVLVAVSGKPLLFIPVQLFHGVGWTFHYVGMVNLADTRAHRDLRATYQGLLHVFMLIGGTLGNFVGPVIMSGLDSTRLMAINAGVLILAIVYFVTAVRENPSSDREER